MSVLYAVCKFGITAVGIIGAAFCFHEAVWWRENRYETSPVIWLVCAGVVLLLLGVAAGAL